MKMARKKKLENLKKKHNQYIKSLGVDIDIETGEINNRFEGYPFPDYSSNRKSLPCSNRIVSGATKREVIKPKLPEGKTISIAYNKGNYQVVDIADITTMGRKV